MKQFASALHYVHSKGIIHTDIKTENILIKANGVVTLIDFGCAIYEREYHPPALGTQEYRSPEALLQCGWSYPTDIWSAGCVFAELLIGETLFPHGAFEDFHLLCIQTTLEQQIPGRMLSAASSHPNPSNPISFISYSQGCPQLTPRRLERPPSPHRAQPLRALVKDPEHLALLRRMLALQPAHRLTASQLREAFLHQARQAARRTMSPTPSPCPAAPSSSSAPDPTGAVRLERAVSSPPTLPSPSPSPKLTMSRIPTALAVVEAFGPPSPAPPLLVPSAAPQLHPAAPASMGRRLMEALTALQTHDDSDSNGGLPGLRQEQEPAPAARPDHAAPQAAMTAASTTADSGGLVCKRDGNKSTGDGARPAGLGGPAATTGGAATASGAATAGGAAAARRVRGAEAGPVGCGPWARVGAGAGKKGREVVEAEKRGLQHAPRIACSEAEKKELIGMVLGMGCLGQPCPASGALS
jgi:hypothetical protein